MCYYGNGEVVEIKDEVYANAFFFQQSDQPGLMNILNAIINEAREKKYMYRESLEGLLISFVVELLRINQCERDLKRKEQKLLIIAPAIDYVEKHYREDIKVSKMAEACNISESHFRKIFGEYIGTTHLDFLNLTRVQKACELLTRTDYSIANISYQIGYSNISTFMRNF